jgi:hypothetical protein
VCSRVEKSLYQAPHHLNFSNARPACSASEAERTVQRGAARLVGSATSQLHAVGNAGSGVLITVRQVYLSALRHTTFPQN